MGIGGAATARAGLAARPAGAASPPAEIPLGAAPPGPPAAFAGSVAEDLTARVARLRAEITVLVGLDPAVDGATGPALHAELRTAAGQLQAFAARILARVEADGRWSAGGSRTFPEWVARKDLASTGSVRREVALGRALEESLPGTTAALTRGQVSLEHAEVLARVAATSEARRAALASDHADHNEASLLEAARRMPLDSYRREVDRWATQVDAAAAESEHEAACAKEYLSLARKGQGVALQGFLTLENAEVLATALRAVAGVPSQGETRSREERQAAALVDAGRLILDRGLAGTGQQVRPHLLIHVPAETLRRIQTEDHAPDRPVSDGKRANEDAPSGHAAAGTGANDGRGTGAARFDGLPPAYLHDGTPLPPSSLARLVCDGELTRIVFAADGAVLDVGRAQRTYSGQQRVAVIARDQSCRYPGCGAPPTLGEIHHVTSWASGGRTAVANGVLLCWFHHGLVHRRGIRIRRGQDGWVLHRDDGSPIEIAHTTTGGASSGAGSTPGSGGPNPTAATHPIDGPITLGPPPSAWGGPTRAAGGPPPDRPPGVCEGVGHPRGAASSASPSWAPARA